MAQRGAQSWEGKHVNRRAACPSVDRHLKAVEQGCLGYSLTLMFIEVVGASLPTLFFSLSLPGLAARSIPLKVDYDWGKMMGLFDQCLPEPAPPRAAIQPPSLSPKYMDTSVPYSLWRLVFIWPLEDGLFSLPNCYHS